MQREIICDILALAAPDSITKGYAQCWVNLVQAMQPGRESQEAASLARLFEQYSCCLRLSFHVGAAAAPILTQGILGGPSVKLAAGVLTTYIHMYRKRTQDLQDLDYKFDRAIIELLTGMLSAAPGATMAVAQQNDTRGEVQLSYAAAMLGRGAVLLDNRIGPGEADANKAEAWCAWIFQAEVYSGLDMTITAMSLTQAMSDLSWQGCHCRMPDLMNLLEYLLLREADDEYAGIRLDDNLKLFESSLVGALLGLDIKIVKIDS